MITRKPTTLTPKTSTQLHPINNSSKAMELKSRCGSQSEVHWARKGMHQPGEFRLRDPITAANIVWIEPKRCGKREQWSTKKLGTSDCVRTWDYLVRGCKSARCCGRRPPRSCNGRQALHRSATHFAGISPPPPNLTTSSRSITSLHLLPCAGFRKLEQAMATSRSSDKPEGHPDEWTVWVDEYNVRMDERWILLC